MARGKRTRRSQRHAQQRDYLAAYGYPSAKELRREAQGLAGASVPTVRQVSRPYERQIQSSKDYLEAVRAALAETQASVGSDYQQAVDQSQGVSDAAQARLAGLGLGSDQSGVQAAVGARGDSATQGLIANQAAAGNYAAQLPAIAAGSASQFADVTHNKLLDALASRRDDLSQAFFQALQQVQGNALQRASFNQSADQFNQNLSLQRAQMAQSASQFAAGQAESVREFNATMAYNYASLGAQYGGKAGGKRGLQALAQSMGRTPNELSGDVKDATTLLLGSGPETDKVPKYGPNGKVIGYKNVSRAGSGSLGAVDAGVPFATAIAELARQGVDPRIATYAASQIYKQALNTNYDAWRSFAEWMARNGSARYRRILSTHAPTQAKHPYGPHH